jgi:excisionase family DNA binding protein
MALKDSYFTISEAASYLHVTRQTISRWIKKGELKVEKVGREVLIKKDGIENFRRRRADKSFNVLVMNPLIEIIRKKFAYSKEDNIQWLMHDYARSTSHPGIVKFLIARKDGGLDIVALHVISGKAESGDVFIGANEIVREQFIKTNETIEHLDNREGVPKPKERGVVS